MDKKNIINYSDYNVMYIWTFKDYFFITFIYFLFLVFLLIKIN